MWSHKSMLNFKLWDRYFKSCITSRLLSYESTFFTFASFFWRLVTTSWCTGFWDWIKGSASSSAAILDPKFRITILFAKRSFTLPLPIFILVPRASFERKKRERNREALSTSMRWPLVDVWIAHTQLIIAAFQWFSYPELLEEISTRSSGYECFTVVSCHSEDTGKSSWTGNS